MAASSSSLLYSGSVVHVVHGELTEGDVELSTPDCEVSHLVNGWLLRRQQQHQIFLVVTTDLCLNARVGSENCSWR